MSGQAPQRVDNIERYWEVAVAPPVRSARCVWWEQRIKAGWRGNRRISSMGYYEKAAYFGVYIWELVHVLSPAIEAR